MSYIDQDFEKTAASHTPGPWETSTFTDGITTDWDVCEKGGGDMIADLNGCDNAEANARLIAAAPDLLAALRYMVEAQNTFFDHADRRASLAKAREAIAKAEGREP